MHLSTKSAISSMSQNTTLKLNLSSQDLSRKSDKYLPRNILSTGIPSIFSGITSEYAVKGGPIKYIASVAGSGTLTHGKLRLLSQQACLCECV